MNQKNLDECFNDRFNQYFGYGYGTGEKPVLSALKTFFESFGDNTSSERYNYQTLEKALGSSTA